MDYGALLSKECVRHSLQSTDVPSAVRELLELAKREGLVFDAKAVTDAVLEREQRRCTCHTFGLKFPRATSPSSKQVAFAVGLFDQPVTCECEKGHRIKILVVMTGPAMTGPYLKAMMRVAHGLSVPEVLARIGDAWDEEELYKAFLAATRA